MTVEQFNQAEKLVNKIEFLESVKTYLAAPVELLHPRFKENYSQEMGEIVPLLTEPIETRLAELNKQFEQL